MALLLETLDEGDLEIRFHDGRSTKAHSQHLKLASRGGILRNLVEDVLDDEITGCKRKRADSGTVDLPFLKVSPVDTTHHGRTTLVRA